MIFILYLVITPTIFGVYAEKQVPLTFSLLEEPSCNFEVIPNEIDFGDILPRDTSIPQTLTITNIGNQDILSLSIQATHWLSVTAPIPPSVVFLSSATKVTMEENFSVTKKLPNSGWTLLTLESPLRVGESLNIYLLVDLKGKESEIPRYVGEIHQTITIDQECDTEPPIITVPDTEPPIIFGPDDMTVRTSESQSVIYDIYAIDVVDGDVGVACSPPFDHAYPMGTTTVTCTATDSSGNTASYSFRITLVNCGDGLC